MNRHGNGRRDHEASATLRALRRAARRARELGAKTRTPVYVIQNDRIVDLTKEDRRVPKSAVLRREAQRSS